MGGKESATYVLKCNQKLLTAEGAKKRR